MTSFGVFTILTLLFFLNNQINGQNFASPCPTLFVYQKTKEPGRWDGIVTLLSDTDLQGIWLRLLFDRPSLLLGNWFGQANPRNENKEYVIKNRDFQLKAHTPQTIPIYIQYDTNAPAPQLTGFRLNARMVCPEGEDESSTLGPLHTSDLGASVPQTSSGAASVPQTGNQGDIGGFIKPGGVNLGSVIETEYFSSSVSILNDPDLNAVCGTITAIQPQPLITHGQATKEGEYPWHAAIYQTKGVNLDYLCGASLVTKSHILTAAHCVTKPRTTRLRDPESMLIYLGRYYLHRFTKGIQEKLVDNMIPHPSYNGERLRNDIAVVKLKEPVTISDYVRPVCLWQESMDLNKIVNRLGSVVGWGIDETGELTDQLMQTKMPVVSQETCLRSLPTFYPLFTSNSTYCAGFANGTSVCNGDSGGGMVFPRSNSDQNKEIWQLRGIVSLSVDLDRRFKCDSTHYIVFTDTAKHLNWIKEALQQP